MASINAPRAGGGDPPYALGVELRESAPRIGGGNPQYIRASRSYGNGCPIRRGRKPSKQKLI